MVMLFTIKLCCSGPAAKHKDFCSHDNWKGKPTKATIVLLHDFWTLTFAINCIQIRNWNKCNHNSSMFGYLQVCMSLNECPTVTKCTKRPPWFCTSHPQHPSSLALQMQPQWVKPWMSDYCSHDSKLCWNNPVNGSNMRSFTLRRHVTIQAN